jgi:hypothetical protein
VVKIKIRAELKALLRGGGGAPPPRPELCGECGAPMAGTVCTGCGVPPPEPGPPQARLDTPAPFTALIPSWTPDAGAGSIVQGNAVAVGGGNIMNQPLLFPSAEGGRAVRATCISRSDRHAHRAKPLMPPPPHALPQPRTSPGGCTTKRLVLAAGAACCLLLALLLVVLLASSPPPPTPSEAALLAFKVSVAARRTIIGGENTHIVHAVHRGENLARMYMIHMI